jgi:hypothetical protein
MPCLDAFLTGYRRHHPALDSSDRARTPSSGRGPRMRSATHDALGETPGRDCFIVKPAEARGSEAKT